MKCEEPASAPARSDFKGTGGNPRAWTSVPGRIPSFLYLYIYIYRDKRIAARATRAGANLAGPNDVRPIINIFRKEVFLVNLEHPFGILQKGGVPVLLP